MVCALVVSIASTIVANRMFSQEVLADRENEYRLMIHQTLNSMNLTSKDIESALVSLSSSTDFSATVQQMDIPASTRSRDIVSKLRYMCYNNSYFTAMCFVDEHNNVYYGARELGDSGTVMRSVIQNRIHQLSGQYTQWFSDANGDVFVKKDVYTVTPLYRCGMLIARLDTPYLRSLLGVDLLAERTGNSVLLTAQGDPVLISGSMSYDQALEFYRKHLEDTGTYSDIIQMDGTNYYLQADELQFSWKMMHVIPLEHMLAITMKVSKMNLLICAVIFAFSIPLLFLFSHSLTKGVKRLYKTMNEVSKGRFDIVLRPQSKDEIGMLTQHFGWLVGELKNVTEERINRAMEKQQAEYEMLEVKYRSLQAQVSPHFICNILTTINVMNEMGKTEKVTDLSVLAGRYLRSNLKAVDEKIIVLEKEIEHVEAYLEIYRAVYGDYVKLEKEIPQEVLPLAVPNMILQPLVENALMHGGIHHGEVCRLTLQAEISDEWLFLRLGDNGNGIEPSLLAELNHATPDVSFDKKLKGFGLKGVIQRLRFLYGSNHHFEITSSGSGTQIVIQLPAQPYPSDDTLPNGLPSPHAAAGTP